MIGPRVATPGMATSTRKPWCFTNKLTGAVDPLASRRARHAVPDWQQRRIERAISQDRRTTGTTSRGAA